MRLMTESKSELERTFDEINISDSLFPIKLREIESKCDTILECFEK